jgi:membrane-bound ClpP family serine protease
MEEVKLGLVIKEFCFLGFGYIGFMGIIYTIIGLFEIRNKLYYRVEGYIS